MAARGRAALAQEEQERVGAEHDLGAAWCGVRASLSRLMVSGLGFWSECLAENAKLLQHAARRRAAREWDARAQAERKQDVRRQAAQDGAAPEQNGQWREVLKSVLLSTGARECLYWSRLYWSKPVLGQEEQAARAQMWAAQADEGFSAEQVPVSAYGGSSKNLEDLHASWREVLASVVLWVGLVRRRAVRRQINRRQVLGREKAVREKGWNDRVR